MNVIPSVKFFFDRKKKASKTTDGIIEIIIYLKSQRIFLGTGIGVSMDIPISRSESKRMMTAYSIVSR